MKVDVKICGLTRAEDMEACAVSGVRWVGLVFHSASPRFVRPEQAARLHEAIASPSAGGPLRVGLFVRPTHEQIAAVLERIPLDILQLYTDEATAFTLKEQTGRPVWLARGVAQKHDLPVSKAMDGYVIEAPAQKGDTRPGGLGRVFDWTLTRQWQAPAPWLLAGGLTPDNVSEAVRVSRAQAVDVSSGVEEAPGIKSALLIEKFVKNSQKKACTRKE